MATKSAALRVVKKLRMGALNHRQAKVTLMGDVAGARITPALPPRPTSGEVSSVPAVIGEEVVDRRRIRTTPNPFLPHYNEETGRWRGPQVPLRLQAKIVKAVKNDPVARALLPPGPKFVPPPLTPEVESEVAKLARTIPIKDEVARQMKIWRDTPEVQALRAGMSASEWADTTASMRHEFSELMRKQEHGLRVQEDPPLSRAHWVQEVAWTSAARKPLKEKAAVSVLYAGRKRMFKTHKWERAHADRMEEREKLLAAMDRRVKTFRATYRRRQPDPLKPMPAKLRPKKPPF